MFTIMNNTYSGLFDDYVSSKISWFELLYSILLVILNEVPSVDLQQYNYLITSFIRSCIVESLGISNNIISTILESMINRSLSGGKIVWIGVMLLLVWIYKKIKNVKKCSSNNNNVKNIFNINSLADYLSNNPLKDYMLFMYNDKIDNVMKMDSLDEYIIKFLRLNRQIVGDNIIGVNYSNDDKKIYYVQYKEVVLILHNSPKDGGYYQKLLGILCKDKLKPTEINAIINSSTTPPLNCDITIIKHLNNINTYIPYINKLTICTIMYIYLRNINLIVVLKGKAGSGKSTIITIISSMLSLPIHKGNLNELLSNTRCKTVINYDEIDNSPLYKELLDQYDCLMRGDVPRPPSKDGWEILDNNILERVGNSINNERLEIIASNSEDIVDNIMKINLIKPTRTGIYKDNNKKAAYRRRFIEFEIIVPTRDNLGNNKDIKLDVNNNELDSIRKRLNDLAYLLLENNQPSLAYPLLTDSTDENLRSKNYFIPLINSIENLENLFSVSTTQ